MADIASPPLFVLDGEPIGTEAYEDGVYSANLWVGDVPGLVLANPGPWDSQQYGELQETGHEALDNWLFAHSPARGLPRDFFPPEVDISPLTRHAGAHLAAFFSQGRLVLDVEGTLQDGREIAGFLARQALALDDYQTWVGFAADSDDDEPVADRLEEVRALLEKTGEWVQLRVARQQNALEGRGALAGFGDALELRLTAPWERANCKRFGLRISGSILPGAPRISLEPQSRGLMGYLRALGELKVGDDALDERYIIRGPKRALPFLQKAAAPLKGLGPFEMRVDIFNDLVTVEGFLVPREELGELLQNSLEIWRLAALVFSGGDA